MDFVFVRTVFNWGVSQYSTYSFVTSFAAIVGRENLIYLTLSFQENQFSYFRSSHIHTSYQFDGDI